VFIRIIRGIRGKLFPLPFVLVCVVRGKNLKLLIPIAAEGLKKKGVLFTFKEV
jgi:hypothetical protein